MYQTVGEIKIAPIDGICYFGTRLTFLEGQFYSPKKVGFVCLRENIGVETT
jgi:hypothetical protein